VSSFADYDAARSGNNRGCPRCESPEKNAGAVSLQLRQLDPGSRSARAVATRCRNLCEACAIAVYECLLAEFERQISHGGGVS
jgi:hypothetical protein